MYIISSINFTGGGGKNCPTIFHFYDRFVHKKVRALFIVASQVSILSNFLKKGGGFLNYIVSKFNVFYFKIRERREGV